MVRVPLLATAFLLLSLPASALVFNTPLAQETVQGDHDVLIDFDPDPARKINMTMLRVTEG